MMMVVEGDLTLMERLGDSFYELFDFAVSILPTSYVCLVAANSFSSECDGGSQYRPSDEV